MANEETKFETKTDDLPHAIDVHAEKLTATVNSVSTTSLEGIRRIRDKADDVVRAINERAESVHREIEAFQQIARHTLDNAKIMEDALEKITNEFKIQSPRATAGALTPGALTPAMPPAFEPARRSQSQPKPHVEDVLKDFLLKTQPPDKAN